MLTGDSSKSVLLIGRASPRLIPSPVRRAAATPMASMTAAEGWAVPRAARVHWPVVVLVAGTMLAALMLEGEAVMPIPAQTRGVRPLRR